MEAAAYQWMYEIEEKLWWYKGRRRVCFSLLERVLSGLAPGPAEREILDVGCGTGYNLRLLRRFGRVRGVDTAEEALAFCRLRGEEAVTLHGAEGLPFASQTFDLVTAFDVLEHIEDDRGALREFRRVLKPGGLLLVYTPALPWLYNAHDRIVRHQRRYRREELAEKLERAGFRQRHLAYVNGLVLPLVLLARALASWRGGSGRHQEMELPHPVINALVTALCYAENALVQRDLLPLGMTLLALVENPEPASSLPEPGI